MRINVFFYFFLVPIGCAFSQGKVASDTKENSAQFYHYSIWWAFVNKIYDGELSVERLKQNGDIALGSYSELDGELIMNNGRLYRIREDGSVSVVTKNATISYANATFFRPGRTIHIDSAESFASFHVRLNEHIESRNIFYAFKVHGRFSYIKCGGLHHQKRPYTTALDVLIPNRPTFEKQDVTGTMIGFFCPDFIGNINVASYHFHFISDDERFGGHVMEMEAFALEVELMPIYSYVFELPRSSEFKNVGFERQFQYKSN